MTTLFLALLTAATSNLIFTHALGMSTLATSAKSKTDFIGIGLVITLFTTCGSALTYVADRFWLSADSRLRPFVYGVLLAALYVVFLVTLHAAGKSWFLRFRKYVHLSAFNCAVLGTLMLGQLSGGGFGARVQFGLESGLGFLLASCMLKAVYPKLTSERVPASVRGYPAILLYIGILSMALYGINR